MKKTTKIISTLIAGLALMIGVAVSGGIIGNSYVADEVHSAQGDVTVHSFQTKLADGWVSSLTPTSYEIASPSRGMQFTNSTINPNGLSLTYDSNLYFDQITVTAATNGTFSNTNISISVGGNNFDTSKTLTASVLTIYTFQVNTAIQGAIIVKVSTTNTNKSTYIKEITTREGVGATGTISIANSEERIQLGNSVVITPTLGGTGTLNASVGDATIASLSLTATTITVNSLKVGTTTLTASYGGVSVQVNIEVFDPHLIINQSSLSLIPEEQTIVTAAPIDFTPTSYLWNKTDANGIILLAGANTASVTITATTNLGTASLSVEATDGIITRSANIQIVVQEVIEGTYTISVKSNEYSNPMDLDNLNIAKSDANLSNLVFSNINNTRLNSSPVNTNMITIGGNSTTGGEFTVTLPSGLYATSVKFSGLSVGVDNKTPTLKINNGVSFTFDGSTEKTLKPYANALLISTMGTSRIWASTIEIIASNRPNAALDYGTHFLAQTAAECSTLNVSQATWNSLDSIYSNADLSVKNIIKAATANQSGNDLEKAIARYRYIVTKYSYADYMSLGIVYGSSQYVNDDANSNITLIIVVSILGLSTLVGYKLLTKKKEID